MLLYGAFLENILREREKKEEPKLPNFCKAFDSILDHAEMTYVCRATKQHFSNTTCWEELTLIWAQGWVYCREFALTRVKEAKDKAQERKKIIIMMNMVLKMSNEEIKI